jgi:hypothetical protein
MNKLEQTINFLSNMEKVFYKDFVNNPDDTDNPDDTGIKRDEVKQLRHVISLLEMERDTYEEGDYDNGI